MSDGKSKAQVFAARLFSTVLLVAIVGGTFVSKNQWAYLGLICFLAIAASVELYKMIRANELPCQIKWGLTLSIGYTLTVAYLLATKGAGALEMLGAVDGAAIALAVLASLRQSDSIYAYTLLAHCAMLLNFSTKFSTF